MKFRADKNLLRFLGISFGMILIGAIIAIFVQSMFFVGGGLVLGGFVLLVTGLYVSSKPKEDIIPDERIKKNIDKAGYHAFCLVLLTIGIFNMIEMASPLSIKYLDASTVILLVGIYSFILLKWHYNKKGDA